MEVFYSGSNVKTSLRISASELPPRPAGCIRVVSISDTHGHEGAFSRLPAGDLLIHCGDFTRSSQKQSPKELEANTSKFFSWIEAQAHPHKVLLLGNHEKILAEQGRDFAVEVAKRGCRYLQDSSTRFDALGGLVVYGTPMSFGHSLNNAFQHAHGGKGFWDGIPESADIVASHGPAFAAVPGADTWFAPEFDAVLRARPRVRLCVSGHLHWANGLNRLSWGLPCVNAAVLSQDFKPTGAPVVFDLLPHPARTPVENALAVRRRRVVLVRPPPGAAELFLHLGFAVGEELPSGEGVGDEVVGAVLWSPPSSESRFPDVPFLAVVLPAYEGNELEYHDAGVHVVTGASGLQDVARLLSLSLSTPSPVHVTLYARSTSVSHPLFLPLPHYPKLLLLLPRDDSARVLAGRTFKGLAGRWNVRVVFSEEELAAELWEGKVDALVVVGGGEKREESVPCAQLPAVPYPSSAVIVSVASRLVDTSLVPQPPVNPHDFSLFRIIPRLSFAGEDCTVPGC